MLELPAANLRRHRRRCCAGSREKIASSSARAAGPSGTTASSPTTERKPVSAAAAAMRASTPARACPAPPNSGPMSTVGLSGADATRLGRLSACPGVAAGYGFERLEAARGREVLVACLRRPERIPACGERASGELLERGRLGEQEPLAGHAAERQQRRDLRLELDALGHGLEAERLAERDDGARELGAVVGVGQAADEGAVDFKDVDREAMQVGERGIAGAEIVDREPHSESLQAVEALEVRVRVVHDGALG